MRPSRPMTFLLYFAIPLVAILVAGRQGYLSTYDELSTWKGGGMGMFASADSTDTRFMQFFIEMADGRREPIIGLTDAQTAMVKRFLWYPSERAFKPLAQSIRNTAFLASDAISPVYRYSLKGERLEPLDRKYHLLYAHRPRPSGQVAEWNLVGEYYRLKYDPATRVAQFLQGRTLRAPKDRAP